MNTWKQIKTDYLSGLSIAKIRKKYYTVDFTATEETISRFLKREGIVVINKQNDRGTNHTVFSEINTEEKAYWLGFLFADGSVSKKDNIIELSLKSSDINHLIKFKAFIGAENKISQDKIRCRYLFSSKQMKIDLIKLGCTPNKSLTLKFPKIKKDLLRHFIRGYFDGDGCITYRRTKSTLSIVTSFLGTKDVLTNIMSELDINKILYPKVKICYFLMHKKDSRICLNYMYKDCLIYLDRKYHRYQVFNKYSYAVPLEKSEELLLGNIGGTLSL